MQFHEFFKNCYFYEKYILWKFQNVMCRQFRSKNSEMVAIWIRCIFHETVLIYTFMNSSRKRIRGLGIWRHFWTWCTFFTWIWWVWIAGTFSIHIGVFCPFLSTNLLLEWPSILRYSSYFLFLYFLLKNKISMHCILRLFLIEYWPKLRGFFKILNDCTVRKI